MRGLLIVATLLDGPAWFVWDGPFNVAATEHDAPLTMWLIFQMRDRSIAVRTGRGPASVSLTDPRVIPAGFRRSHTMCLTCPSAPERRRRRFGRV